MERNKMYKNGIPQFDGQKYALEDKDEEIYIGTGI